MCSTERQEALNTFIAMLHEKMTERKAGDDGALSDDEFLQWLESKAEPFFPYTVHSGQVVWGTGELSKGG